MTLKKYKQVMSNLDIKKEILMITEEQKSCKTSSAIDIKGSLNQIVMYNYLSSSIDKIENQRNYCHIFMTIV